MPVIALGSVFKIVFASSDKTALSRELQRMIQLFPCGEIAVSQAVDNTQRRGFPARNNAALRLFAIIGETARLTEMGVAFVSSATPVMAPFIVHMIETL